MGSASDSTKVRRRYVAGPRTSPVVPSLVLIDPAVEARPTAGVVATPSITGAATPGRAVRIFDVSVAATALIVLAPLMALVALSVKLSSRGPILYGSMRLGRDGANFAAWKFRSMWPDADARLTDVLAASPEARAEYRTYRKLLDDPRVTPLGRFLRRSSLDELPQLYNILSGQMSVVGPRPKLLNEEELYGPALAEILQVRPGLTGLWQIKGRSKLSIDERIRLDTSYVRKRSLLSDIAICLTTFFHLWRPGRHGAV